MAIPRTYKTEAIILKHSNFGEADRIVTLFTPNYGKIRAVARGVRRMKSKLGGHVEPINCCSMMISHGRNLETINQSQIIEDFPPVHRDLDLTAQAAYLVELVDVFNSEHSENYPVYKLLLNSLRHLGKTRKIDLLFRYFEVQLLGHLGYRPELFECVQCRSAPKPVENFFSCSGGGIICPGCAPSQLNVRPLSLNALKVLRLLQAGEYANASRLRLSTQLSCELNQTLQEYIRYLLERELKSTSFIEHLKKEPLGA